MEEKWKDIEGYEGAYQISNFGRVKSFPRYWVKSERILKPKGSPYPKVSLFKNKKRNYKDIHVLVATAFVPNPDNKPVVDHIDGNPKNNVWTNLRWTDYKGNSNNPISKKRMSSSMVDNKNGNKSVVMFDGNMNKINEFKSLKDASKYIEKKDSHQISFCCQGKQKKAYGYIWKYKKDAV